MPDIDAIAVALAARFAPGQVTPPSGLPNLRSSTANVPNQMTALPAVLVFPDEGEFLTGNGTRTGTATFIVRFYYNDGMDLLRNSVALRKWATVLVDQLKTSVQLSGTVVRATVDSWRIVVLTYFGKEYSGVEISVGVTTSEPWAAVA